MRTFAQKQNRPKKPVSSSLARSNMVKPGPAHREHPILQRAIGNQALLRMLQTNKELEAGLTGTASPRVGHDFNQTPIPPPAAGAIQAKLAISKPGDEYEREADRISGQVMRMPDSQLQRACPCGGGCSHCQEAKIGSAMQPMLTIGASNDTYEQEADRVANQVMRMSELQVQRAMGLEEKLPEETIMQTKALPAKAHWLESGAPAPVMSPHSGGQPLSTNQLTFFEPRFGADFSKVRIHQGAQAAEAARSVGARAYTLGHNIVFGQGEYQPATPSGQYLLAHELTHVIQQIGNGQTHGALAYRPLQVQRASLLEDCTDTQADTVNTAFAQAMQDLDTAIALLEPRPLSQKAQDAMWLTFRDTEDLKVFIVRELLRTLKDGLPREQIVCEQLPYYSKECKNGSEGYMSPIGGSLAGVINLCMGQWDAHEVVTRVETLIHEAAHHFFKGDPGYFGESCKKTSVTARLSIAELFHTPDSYSCLVYLLAHETGEALRSRVSQEQRESRGETLEIIAAIPFDTRSNEPGDSAMAELTSQLVRYQESLHGGEYYIDFDGHASRTGDDAYNQTLSEQRAQAVNDRLKLLVGAALENPNFEFAPYRATVEGHGEERARDAGKPADDNSQSDRVVDVVVNLFSIR
jgi:outer membrane protein OmpA-like peptidoglycan-associated protein